MQEETLFLKSSFFSNSSMYIHRELSWGLADCSQIYIIILRNILCNKGDWKTSVIWKAYFALKLKQSRIRLKMCVVAQTLNFSFSSLKFYPLISTLINNQIQRALIQIYSPMYLCAKNRTVILT